MVRIFNGLILAMAVFLMNPGGVLAVSPDAKEGTPHKGSQALQFQVASNFRLTTFQGSLISYIKFLSDRRALRVGVDVLGHTGDRDITFEFPDYDSLRGEGNPEDWNHQYALVSQLLTLQKKGPIRFYYGGGPKLSYVNTGRESIDFRIYYDELERVSSKDTYRTWGLGLSGTAGVQRVLNDYLTLHAEYGLSIMYQWGRQTSEYQFTENPERDKKSTTDISSFDVRSEGVRFGLSVYF
jgi:hypothetical protein